MQRVLDEPDERDGAGESEHEREAILDHGRDMAAPRRRLLARDSGCGPPFRLGIVRRSLGASERSCIGAVDQGIDGNDILCREPELLILRPGDFGDDDMSAAADFDIGSSARGRGALHQQAPCRDIADANVEPAGILLQACRDQHLPAKVPPLVRLR